MKLYSFFQDLQQYIEDSPHGVIYFSFGSMIKASSLSGPKLKAFQDAFASLPQRVLWKWENDTMPGKPDNVEIRKWLPQFDILSKKYHFFTCKPTAQQMAPILLTMLHVRT